MTSNPSAASKYVRDVSYLERRVVNKAMVIYSRSPRDWAAWLDNAKNLIALLDDLDAACAELDYARKKKAKAK